MIRLKKRVGREVKEWVRQALKTHAIRRLLNEGRSDDPGVEETYEENQQNLRLVEGYVAELKLGLHLAVETRRESSEQWGDLEKVVRANDEVVERRRKKLAEKEGEGG